jgi:hypothetical protein
MFVFVTLMDSVLCGGGTEQLLKCSKLRYEVAISDITQITSYNKLLQLVLL